MELSHAVVQSIHQEELDVKQLRQDVIASVTGVEYIEKPISYERFFTDYLLPNKACVLGPWATEGWISRQEWVTKEKQPNVQVLKQMFGEARCPVADCKQTQYDAHTKRDMSLAEFIDYMIDCKQEDYPPDKDCLYLKDWHFQREFPDYKAYSVPSFFESDWMNEYWDKRDDMCDDYRFVYIGPRGSWTPFHSDVLRSYSWSANICGRKKWIMFPPGEEEHLKDKLGHLPFDLSSSEMEDDSIYPAVAKVTKRFEVYQEAGEIMFVPSGWFHQVYNMEDTISINHNWSNACNADLLWLHLVNSMKKVQREISDCCDMEGWANQCQLILKADAGMDYADFYQFLCTIADRRLSVLRCHNESASGSTDILVRDFENKSSLCDVKSDSTPEDDMEHTKHGPKEHISDGITWSMNHFVFDLLKIKDLIFHMKRNKEFLQLDFDQFEIRPKAILQSIDNVLDEHFLSSNTNICGST